MAHTITAKKSLLTRIRRIQGQATALERALEEGAECTSVLQQIAAIRGAVGGLMNEVLEGHIKEHLSKNDVDQVTRETDIESLLSALRSYLK